MQTFEPAARAARAVSVWLRFRRGVDVVHTDFQHYLGALGRTRSDARHHRLFRSGPDLDLRLFGHGARLGAHAQRLDAAQAGCCPRVALCSATVWDGPTTTICSPPRCATSPASPSWRWWIWASGHSGCGCKDGSTRRPGRSSRLTAGRATTSSSSPPPPATRRRPLPEGSGSRRLCCTELEVCDGHITGNALPCFGLGKLSAAEHLAHQRETDLARAYFYSDSSDDLPLLEAVGRPVVVNPRLAMARLARSRGWPCLIFAPPGDMRTAAA